jgi:hypothetical protein
MFRPNEQVPSKYGENRDWNVDLIPKFVMANGIFNLTQATWLKFYLLLMYPSIWIGNVLMELSSINGIKVGCFQKPKELYIKYLLMIRKPFPLI